MAEPDFITPDQLSEYHTTGDRDGPYETAIEAQRQGSYAEWGRTVVVKVGPKQFVVHKVMTPSPGVFMGKNATEDAIQSGIEMGYTRDELGTYPAEGGVRLKLADKADISRGYKPSEIQEGEDFIEDSPILRGKYELAYDGKDGRYYITPIPKDRLNTVPPEGIKIINQETTADKQRTIVTMSDGKQYIYTAAGLAGIKKDTESGRFFFEDGTGRAELMPDGWHPTGAGTQVQNANGNLVETSRGQFQFVPHAFEPGVHREGDREFFADRGGGFTELGNVQQPGQVETIGGQQYIRGINGELEPLSGALGRVIEQALIEGNVDKARKFADFRDAPSPERALELELEFARSPADTFAVSAIARGETPVAPPPRGETQRIAPQTDAAIQAHKRMQESISGSAIKDPAFQEALKEKSELEQLQESVALLKEEKQFAKLTQQMKDLETEKATGFADTVKGGIKAGAPGSVVTPPVTPTPTPTPTPEPTPTPTPTPTPVRAAQPSPAKLAELEKMARSDEINRLRLLLSSAGAHTQAGMGYYMQERNDRIRRESARIARERSNVYNNREKMGDNAQPILDQLASDEEQLNDPKTGPRAQMREVREARAKLERMGEGTETPEDRESYLKTIESFGADAPPQPLETSGLTEEETYLKNDEGEIVGFNPFFNPTGLSLAAVPTVPVAPSGEQNVAPSGEQNVVTGTGDLGSIPILPEDADDAAAWEMDPDRAAQVAARIAAMGSFGASIAPSIGTATGPESVQYGGSPDDLRETGLPTVVEAQEGGSPRDLRGDAAWVEPQERLTETELNQIMKDRQTAATIMRDTPIATPGEGMGPLTPFEMRRSGIRPGVAQPPERVEYGPGTGITTDWMPDWLASSIWPSYSPTWKGGGSEPEVEPDVPSSPPFKWSILDEKGGMPAPSATPSTIPVQDIYRNPFGEQWSGAGIERRAGGGPVFRDTLAIVGEEGPEMVKLPQGARVIPADATREMRRGRRPIPMAEGGLVFDTSADLGWPDVFSIGGQDTGSYLTTAQGQEALRGDTTLGRANVPSWTQEQFRQGLSAGDPWSTVQGDFAPPSAPVAPRDWSNLSSSQVPAGVRRVHQGLPLAPTRNRLFRAAGLTVPSAQALRNFLPEELEVFREQGRLAGIPEGAFNQELIAGLPSGGAAPRSLALAPRRMRR